MMRPLSPLRSWLKEERRLFPRSVRLWWVGLSSLSLLTLLLAVEVRRRETRVNEALESQRLGQLELVRAALADIRRTAFDWARWEDAPAFVQGRNPRFVQGDMAQSSLFAGGGVMALFDWDGQPLVRYSTAGIDEPEDLPLQRCAVASLGSLRSLDSAVELLCHGADRRPYLGVLTQVSNNASTAPANGALVMFEPMIRPAHGPRLSRQLETLAAQMVSGAAADGRPLPDGFQLKGADGSPIALSPQSSLMPLLESLRDDLVALLVCWCRCC